MTLAPKHILFIVPARGGSKGVPRKNVALLAGQPLIAHVLIAAKEAIAALDDRNSRLLVSTDDEAIADAARQYGAVTPFLRPATLAQDDTPSIDVVRHALDMLYQSEADRPSTVVLLQATSPLVQAEDICQAVRLFEESRSPVVSVTQNEHPLEWSFYLENDCRLSTLMPERSVARRQDARATYRLNGAIFIASPEQLYATRSFLTSEARGYVMPGERSIDIDTRLDFQVVETILANQAIESAGAVIEVAGKKIGASQPCFIIAEAGVNHNGDMALAHQLIDAAAEAKADAVKFQTFIAEELATADAPKAEYQKLTTGVAESQLAMLQRLELKPEHHSELKQHATERGLIFLSTPFETASADFLEALDIAAFKLPSGEITNLPFISHVARKGRPLLLSTGMSTLEEVREAVKAIRNSGCPPLALFHCVSCYPASASDCNLRAMQTLRCAFGVPVGFSDHTMGIAVPVAAVTLGANLIEKHLTLARTLDGPDHAASLEPTEFKAMVEAIRTAEAAFGHVIKQPTAGELETARVARKSLTAASNVNAGSTLTAELIAVRRPGTGLPPSSLNEVLGRRLRRDVKEGNLLSWEDIDGA